ncbi:MAG: PQQ-binding-like beta-propeller repeat protein [Candidatus Zhuqueibacterota bacterium]
MNRLKHISKIISIFLLALAQCSILPDFEPPSVTIHSPKAGESAYGSVEIVAEASDNNRLDRMELYLDGDLVQTARENTIRFTWDLTQTNSDADHSVRVKAIDRSDNWINAEVKFFGYGKLPEKPVLLSPISGVKFTVGAPLLDWSDVSSAERYHLQVDDNQDFSSPFISDVSLSTSEYELTVLLDVNKAYFWRVRAKLEWTYWSEWSETGDFFIMTYEWKILVGDGVSTSPAIDFDGNIYVGSFDGTMYALSINGVEKWRFKTDAIINSAATIASDGSIYFGSNDGNLYALDKDGNLKWKFETGAAITASPAIGYDGIIYIGSDDYHFYAITPDGQVKWKFETDGGIGSSAAIDQSGNIYFGCDDGYIYALKYNGYIKWKYKTGGDVDSSPAVGPDGIIYIGSYDEHLYAINSDGTLRWEFELDGQGSPTINVDGTVVVRSGLNLVGISLGGVFRWSRRLTNGVTDPALSSDGTIYVGATNPSNMLPLGDFYLLDSVGDLIKKYEIGPTWDICPAINDKGTVFIATRDGYLHAINGLTSGLATSYWPKFQHDSQNTGRARN